ncbi:hypothetical protein [Georgenia ruanii]|nr:hypothetical protein [Georgenia ruanii]
MNWLRLLRSAPGWLLLTTVVLGVITAIATLLLIGAMAWLMVAWALSSPA